MDEILWFFLQLFDAVTFGWLSRRGTSDGRLPDPADVWEAEELRRVSERLTDEALVGRKGIVVTPLRPAGKIELGSRTYEAASEFGFFEVGERVEVIGRNGFSLIVRGGST